MRAVLTCIKRVDVSREVSTTCVSRWIMESILSIKVRQILALSIDDVIDCEGQTTLVP